VSSLLEQAEALIRVATDSGGVKRDPAARWWSVLQEAQGKEAEQIAFMGEALLVAARGPVEQEWVAALLRGGPEEADSVEKRIMMSETFRRTDASETDQDGIDWANVASEVSTMLELNKAANDAWQGQQGGKGKAQDS
jgi:hypothetical protein